MDPKSKSNPVFIDDLVRIPQLTAARCKFDGLLQQIAERMDASSDEENNQVDIKPYDKKSPKLLSKSMKKKADTTTGTVVTKIQDCSLDMATFNETSALYPMVRAWCKNEHDREYEDSSTSDEEEQDDQRIVTMMPPPHPRSADVPRIPPGLPPHGVGEILIATEGDHLPDPSRFLEEHLARWKIVRQQWKEAAIANEERYFESCEILAKCQLIEDAPENQQEWDGIEPLP